MKKEFLRVRHSTMNHKIYRKTRPKKPTFSNLISKLRKKDQKDPANNNGNYVAKENSEAALIRQAKHFNYRFQFSADQVTGSLFSNDVLITRYEPFTNSVPVTLGNSGSLNGLFKVTVFDMFEDLRFTGMFRIPLINTAGSGVSVGSGGASAFVPTSQSLFNSGTEYLARVDYLKKRMDYTALYYRRTEMGTDAYGLYPIKLYTNLFQGMIKYPLDKVRSIRLGVGVRTDNFVTKGVNDPSLKEEDVKKSMLYQGLNMYMIILYRRRLIS
jgi:hypothetical protein